ncbi:MAG TPA: aromatic ring-hydroxylating dioxygenase subunit alpha, partial [Candidatus Eremiobacteraceae bacterium]|nr:aromatic ring-hydroxylating dioxygenase subunit alpha [Candidatus Eremiobacteraceae bacterium]
MAKHSAMSAHLERTLPRACYTSDAFFARERERIFFHEWFCVGRAEMVPKPGDFMAVDVAGESVVVVRLKDGTLRAHYNVCRHRGSRLVAEDARGTFASTIRCPYHAWTYELDGRLRTAPFLEESDVAREGLCLYPAGVETWAGFLFVLAAQHEDAPTLIEQLGVVPDRLARYPLDALRSARRIVYRVAANWKVLLENYNECYHCGPVHPELCTIVPAFKMRGGADLDWDRGIPHKPGATTFTMTGTTARR